MIFVTGILKKCLEENKRIFQIFNSVDFSMDA